MTENDNLQNLKHMKSSVSERDMKIWENVAHTICIKKETEKLKSEIARMNEELTEKKRENKMIEEQLAELTKSLVIQRQTLRTSERSIVLQKSLNESLLKEANDFKRKYDQTLNLYNKEFEDYRGIQENASKDYQDLKKSKVELKKTEIEKKILDQKIVDLDQRHEQYKKIQEKIFYTTLVKFAEYYEVYHKNEEMKAEVVERKKEEQQLLKEHFRLAEEVNQKKRQEQLKHSVIKESKLNVQNKKASVEKEESNSDKLKKFLSEEYLPCSLTTIDPAQKTLKYNQDKSKVKILETKIIKPPAPKQPSLKKTDLNVRKKIENIMEKTRKEVLRSDSFQINNLEPKVLDKNQKPIFQPKPSNSQMEPKPRSDSELTNSGSQSKREHELTSGPSGIIPTATSPSKSIGTSSKTITPTYKSIISICKTSSSAMKAPSTSLPSNSCNMIPKSQAKCSSQPKCSSNTQTKPTFQIKDSIFRKPNPTPARAIQNQTGVSVDSVSIGKREYAANSILKSSQEKIETVSKFFDGGNTKKKTVTFQNELKKEEIQINKFQLFNREEQPASTAIVKDMNIFQNPFVFKTETFLKQNEKNKKTTPLVLPEIDSSGTNNLTFTMDTAPTTFGTYGDDSPKQDETLDPLLPAFNLIVGKKPAENFDEASEKPTFNFLGSQTKTNNPFSF